MRVPMKGGLEYDALSIRAKRVHKFRTGERKSAKRAYNRRLRRVPVEFE